MSTVEQVDAAAARLASRVHRTPVLTCSSLDAMAGRRLFFKCEPYQRTGSFKIRGALNAVLQLSDDEARRGVVASSSGNFGQALAYAARLRGIPATIVMPTGAAALKRAAVRGYGAQVVLYADTLEARWAKLAEVREQTGATYIPSAGHPDVIAGQGTLALELLEQAPDLDAIVVPVGGGGLISGVALAAGRAGVRVVGAQPVGADDAARSLRAGRRLPPEAPDTVAKGLLLGLCDVTWPLVRDGVDRILTVEDPAILAALRLLVERAKLVVEPSAAVGLAAILSAAFADVPGERVGVVLSGGNVGGEDLAKLLLAAT